MTDPLDLFIAALHIDILNSIVKCVVRHKGEFAQKVQPVPFAFVLERLFKMVRKGS